MSLVSSPLKYPPSSSPALVLEKRKREQDLGGLLKAKRRLLGDNVPSRAEFQKLTSSLSGTEPLVAQHKHVVLQRSLGPFLDDNDDIDDVGSNNGMLDLPGSDQSDMEDAVGTQDSRMIKLVPDNTQHVSRARTSSGKSFKVKAKKAQVPISYERLVAGLSTTKPGKATKNYYGVDIHKLLDQATKEPHKNKASGICGRSNTPRPSIEGSLPGKSSKRGRTMLWTEKYRARKFTDLVGDERTHRDVLRWLKGWDSIVFPGSRPKQQSKLVENGTEARQHRKILMLTGAPGLGKTTLAHVCARQAGYEVVEINASDERSRDVVRGKIRDCVGTENVKGINTKDAGAGTTRKAGRPVCVVADEVDGVVSGSSGGGDGGFIKALIDLVALDQKNSNVLGNTSANPIKSMNKGEKFRLLRPIILICNDVYHPALRPLRSSAMAEIVHIRRPPLDKVVARLQFVFDREGIACDGDGVRRLCEATWGISNKRESRINFSGAGEGDLRGILVVGEWAAAKLRASSEKTARLTKRWVEEQMLDSLSHGGGGARGLGLGGAKEAVERVFLEGAGFPKATSALPIEPLCNIQNIDTLGVSELAKHEAMDRLRDIIDTCGETDRIMNDCFAAYPTRPFQDDTFLGKPNSACEWLHFHDRLLSKVYGGQEWELGPYLSQSVLGFHDLFATSLARQSWGDDNRKWDGDNEEPLPFSGPRADYLASESLKQNRAILVGLRSSLTTQLLRSFRSAEDISTDLIPNLMKILTPDVKPVVVGGSGEQGGIVSVRKEGERQMIQRAVGVMSAVGLTLERTRVETDQSGISNHIYRMEP